MRTWPQRPLSLSVSGTMPKWAQISVAIVGALILWAWVGVPLGLPSIRPCAGYVSTSVSSPSNQYSADIQEESCLPLFEAETTVWLRDNRNGLAGSAFIANSLQEKGPLKVELAWLNDSQLQISFPRGTELKSDAHGFNNATVVYHEIPAVAP